MRNTIIIQCQLFLFPWDIINNKHTDDNLGHNTSDDHSKHGQRVSNVDT